MMTFDYYWITGFAIGAEFAKIEDINYIIIDLGILRLMWESDPED